MASQVGTAVGGEAARDDPKRVAEMEQWRGDLRVLIRCLQDSRTPWYATVLMLSVLAWGVMPVDPIPDVIPLAGIVDDATVFMIVRSGVYSVIPDDVADFHTQVVAEKSRVRFGPARAVGAVAVLQVALIVGLLGGAISLLG